MKKKSNSIIKYFLLMILIPIILMSIAFFLAWLAEPSGLALIGHYLLTMIIVSVASFIITIMLTVKKVNTSFKSESNRINKILIINTLTMFLLFNIINGVISNILIAFKIVEHFSPSLELLYIILVPFIYFLINYLFNKNAIINKKDVYINILIIIIIKLLLFDEILLYLDFSFVIGSIVSSYITCNNNSNKKLVNKKINICFFIIMLVLYIFLKNFNIYNFLIENKSKMNLENDKNDIYCVVPYKTKDDIYFYAYNTRECWGAEYNKHSSKISNTKSIYYLNQQNLEIKKFVSDVFSVYNFESQTDNLYYNLNNASQLYELSSDGGIKKIISSRNPSIMYYENNYIYYIDYSDYDRYKRINLIDYSIEILNDIDDFNDSRNNIYVYNDLIYELKNNNLYVSDNNGVLLKEGKIIFNNDNKFGPKFINNNDVKIIGIYNDYLYYVIDDYHKVSINRLSLSTYYADNLLRTYIDYNDNPANKDNLQRAVIDRRKVNGIKMVDNHIYYTNYEDNGFLHRYNVDTLIDEVLISDNNVEFFDIIDGYIYYIANDYENGSNGFYRFKNGLKEIIVE